MSEGSLVVSTVSIVAMVTCLSLGTYVMLRNPHLKSSRVFFLLACVASLACTADYLLITSTNADAALLAAHPLVFLSIALAATMFYLTAYLPYERELSWVVRNRREYALVVALLGAVPSLMIGEVAEDQWGWWVSTSAPVVWWYAVIFSLYLMSVVSMARLYRADENVEVRRRIVPLALAMVLPGVFGVAVVLVDASGGRSPPVLSITILSSSLLIAYGIFRQNLFVIRPVKEETPIEGASPSMVPGRCVVVEEAKGDHAYAMFVNELASNGRGLVVTSRHPDLVREKYGLKNTPVLWLTPRPGPDSIDPSSIGVLTHTTLQFIQRGPGSVVLFDGFEQLRAFNGPAEVMQLLYALKDAAIVSGSRLIVSVDPAALGPKELPLLERELEPVRPEP